jgi:hypothetical protein
MKSLSCLILLYSISNYFQLIVNVLILSCAIIRKLSLNQISSIRIHRFDDLNEQEQIINVIRRRDKEVFDNHFDGKNESIKKN